MKRKLPLRQVSLVLVLGAIGIASMGQSIFINPITGTNPNTKNPYTIGQTIDVNTSVSGIGRGTGIAGSNANDRYNASGWNSAAMDATDYFEFTITPNSGAKINFVSFVYTGQASGTGPTAFSFRSSIDGYTANIGTPSAAGTTILLSAIAFQGVTSAVTFRLYGWGATLGAGTFSIYDFTFNGAVLPVTSQYYRSKNSGDWNTTATWQFSPDNSTWSNATLIPTASEKSITIQPGHIVTASASISLDETTVNGTLQLLQGGVCNMNDGAGNDIDIQNNGVLQVVSTDLYANTIKQGTAVINVASGGKIEIDNGTAGVGSGYEAFATSLSNIWNNASVFEWNSSTNFVFDNNTYFPNAGGAIVPKFVVSKVTGPVGGSNPVTVNGLLLVNSSFSFAGSGAKTIRGGIAGSAILSIPTSVGTVTINGMAPVLGGSSLVIATDKNINIPNGITVPVDSSVKVMPLTATTPQFAGKGSNNFLVNGSIDMSTVTITNTGGSVIINGTLKTAHLGGLENTGSGGTVSTAGSSTQVNTGSTIEFNAASGNQVVTGSGVLEGSSPYYNIIFSGGSTKKPGNAINVNTNGSVKISGVTTIVDATANNIGLTTPNSTAFTMDGGTLIVGTAETLPLMDGVYNVTGGVIQYKGNNQFIRGSKTYNAIEVYGSNVTAGAGDITLRTNGSFTVKNSGIFTITNNKSINAAPADGTQTVTVENGGTFKCGSNQGFNGFAETFGAWSSMDASVTRFNLAVGSTVDYMYAGNQPVTNANGLVYGNLSLSGSGTKTAPAGTLTVQGNLTTSGTSTFAHNGGTVLLNGANQTFAGLIYNNLILANSIKTTSGNSTIIDSIKLSDNTQLSIRASDSITLQSDASKTARVGQIGNGTINYNSTGKFVVERYINTGSSGGTHGKSWQLLAVPTYSNQTIKDAWQEGATATNISSPVPGSAGNPKGGYGTMLTSNVANATSQTFPGFDAYTPPGPSIKVYNPATDGYDGPASTLVPIGNPKGYFILVRGDRSVTTSNGTANAAKLRTAGQLFTPDVTQQLPPSISVGATQFASVGNPYASAIDIRNLSFGAGISSTVIVWDPTIGGSYGLGAFQALYLSGGNYVNLLTSPGYGTAGTSHNYIQSGQAFIMQGVNPAGGTLHFKESDKAGNSNAALLTPDGAPQNKQQLRANIYEIETDGSGYLTDGVLIDYNQDYSNLIDAMDVRKMNNTAENISLRSGEKYLAIERRGAIAYSDTVFFHLSGVRMQKYRLECIATGLSKIGMNAFLEDGYLHTRYAVDPENITATDFIVNADAASSAADRFRIVFQAAQGPLPLTVTNVKAYTKNEGIAVEWNVEDEAGIKSYQVEKSADGATGFVPSNTIIVVNNRRSGNYRWLDGQPLAGYNYYRIKSTGSNGQVQYSKVIRVWESLSGTGIVVYPNPARNGIIHLLFHNQPAGKYSIKLISQLGQVTLSKQIQHARAALSIGEVQMDASAAHGVYQLEIIKPGGDREISNVVY